MPTRETLETQIASVMEILAKTAVAEICKVVDSGCLEFRVEMCRRQKEIESLRKKVHCLTSERTSSRETWLGLVPQRRTVGVQVDAERGVAESQGEARPLSQDGPISRAAPGLIVKVEQGQQHAALDNTSQQSPGEEFAVDFSVSEVDFPLWAPDMSGSSGTCELGETSFGAPLQTPSETDSSSDLSPGVRADVDPQFSPSLGEKPNCSILPAPAQLAAAPVKTEHRNQCVSTSRSGKAETASQDGYKGIMHTHSTEVDTGKHGTLAHGDRSQQKEQGGQGEGSGWGAGGRLFLCSSCGQGFSSYQRLQAHREEHAGERGSKCGTTQVNGVAERTSSGRQLKCAAEDEDWNCEVERKLQLELQRLQDSFSTQETEHEDQRSHLAHSHNSASALTHTQEPVGFGELQLELKAEQEEEQVDQNLHQGALACEYRAREQRSMEESDFGLGFQGEVSGSRSLESSLKHPAWYCADSLKDSAAFSSQWSGEAGSGEDPPQPRMLTERPGLTGRGLATAIPQGLAAAQARRRETMFSSGSCLASASVSHGYPSSSSFSSSYLSPSSSSSSSSLVHRRFLPTAAGASATTAASAPSQRLFRCPSCPKSFGRATDLERHRRIHTGERPFGCGVCGKRFSLRCNLVTHERVHSGSKPFACRHCGKRFAQASNMKAHQRIHTGERPFHCRLCSRSFTQLSSLKTHQRLHSRASSAQYCT